MRGGAIVDTQQLHPALQRSPVQLCDTLCVMGNSDKLQPLFLLSDEPIDSHLGDRLGMETYRDIITGTVLGTVGPFTIGVYGRWGEGKTSLLRAAESRLRACADEATASPALKSGEPEFPYVVPVWFNPWQYESEEHPLVPLVAEIERAVATALIDEAGILKRYGPTTVKILKGIGLAGLSLLRSVSIKAKVRAGAPGVVGGEIDVGADGKGFVEGFEKAWERAQKGQKSKWQTLVDQSTYLTIFDRLRAVYAELDTARPGAEKRIPRIAVFIDDLDRCQADKAFELIEAIKLVLGQRGFIFILGLDKRIVDAYVQGLWKDRLKERYDQEAARYLDKIVQLPLYLRKHDKSFARFVQGLLDKMKSGGVPADTLAVFEGVKDHLGKSTDFGPRALVRRVNTLLVDQRLRPTIHENDPDEVRDLTPAQFLGLCLVQRTLLDYFDHHELRVVGEDEEFCRYLHRIVMPKRNVLQPNWMKSANQASKAILKGVRLSPSVSGVDMSAMIDDFEKKSPGEKEMRRDTMFKRILGYSACVYVLETEHGLRWLSSHVLRDLVTDFVTSRPVETVPAGAASAATAPPAGTSAAAL